MGSDRKLFEHTKLPSINMKYIVINIVLMPLSISFAMEHKFEDLERADDSNFEKATAKVVEKCLKLNAANFEKCLKTNSWETSKIEFGRSQTTGLERCKLD